MGAEQIKSVPMDALIPPLLEVLAAGGSAQLTTTGWSMKPMLFHRKSVVRLRAPQAPARGDVVLYRYPSGKYALHRIVRCRKDGGFVCRGDNLTVTESVRGEWLLAVVTDFTYRGKWVSRASRGYRLYWRCWLALWPLRYCAMRIWRRGKRETPYEQMGTL